MKKCLHCDERLKFLSGQGWVHAEGGTYFMCCDCGWKGAPYPSPVYCPDCGKRDGPQDDHCVMVVEG